MSIREALDGVQRCITYCDYIPVLNCYTFIPRSGLAITQMAHGAINLTNKQLLNGALNAGRCFVAYKLIYQRQPKPTNERLPKPLVDAFDTQISNIAEATISGFEKRYFRGAPLRRARMIFTAHQRTCLRELAYRPQPATPPWQTIVFGVTTAGLWIGFDLARGSTTLEGLGKIGLLRIPPIIGGLEKALRVADYIPLVSLVSAMGRTQTGFVQLLWGLHCAAGAAVAYPFNALFGAVTPSALMSPVFWSGIGRSGRGLLNIGRGFVAWVPVLSNVGLAAYDSFTT